MQNPSILSRTALMAAICAVFSGAVYAEGAVRVLACETTLQCDAAGHCMPHAEAIEFRMEPKALNADGSGEFTLQYRDAELPMQALSEIGPFVWTQQQDRYTLLASSDTQFLLHTLALADEPRATLQFMSCSLQQ